MWRGLAAVVLVLAGVALLPESASACSCAWGDPREMLANGDAAFVGKLTDKEEPSGGIFSSADEVTYTFEVEQSIKGDLGETVEVESAIAGASCGFEVGEGERIGVILYRDGDGWTGGLCSQVDADALIRASQPIPPPDGEGPVALLIPNPTGASAIVALDAQGRVLAYGESETSSQVERMAVCPGSERVVELVFEGRFPRLAIRNLSTMQVERILRPDGLVEGVRTMECLTPDGETVLLYQMNYLENGAEVRLIRVQGEEAAIIYEAATDWLDYNSVAFDLEHELAYIVDPENRFQVLAISLETGETSMVAQLVEPEDDHGGIFEIEINPSGTRLAVIVEMTTSASLHNLFLIDLMAEPAVSTQVGAGDYSYTNPTWVGEDRLMVNGYWDNSQDVVIYDGSGAPVRTISDFWMQPVVARGDIVYGVGHRQDMSGMFPSLFSMTLPDGEPTVIRSIDRPYVEDLVAVPDDIEIDVKPATNPTEPESTEPPAESTATPVDSTATPESATATLVESGQVGGEDDPSGSDGAVATTGSDTGSRLGTGEMVVGGLVLGAATLGGWLMLRRRRHPEAAAESRT